MPFRRVEQKKCASGHQNGAISGWAPAIQTLDEATLEEPN
jgi:hypothetical protein